MPKGKSGPKSDKIWADAIRRAVHGYHEEKDENGKVRKTRWLNKLAENLVVSASGGDTAAMKEIGDRLDGKPHQSVSGDINHTHTVNDMLNSLDGRDAGVLQSEEDHTTH